MFEGLKTFHRRMIALVTQLGDHRTWFRPGFTVGVVFLMSTELVRAQATVPNMDTTLTAAKTSVKSILDWVIYIAIAVAFVIAIYGIVVGLGRIFSGRGEGLGTLAMGIAATIVGIALISVFATGYNTATA